MFSSSKVKNASVLKKKPVIYVTPLVQNICSVYV